MGKRTGYTRAFSERVVGSLSLSLAVAVAALIHTLLIGKVHDERCVLVQCAAILKRLHFKNSITRACFDSCGHGV